MGPTLKAKAVREKRKKWETSSYRLLFQVLTLLHNLPAFVYFSEFLGTWFSHLLQRFLVVVSKTDRLEWFWPTSAGTRSFPTYFSKCLSSTTLPGHLLYTSLSPLNRLLNGQVCTYSKPCYLLFPLCKIGFPTLKCKLYELFWLLHYRNSSWTRKACNTYLPDGCWPA